MHGVSQRTLSQQIEQNFVIHAVEIRLNVRIDHVLIAEFVAFADARDRPVGQAPGPVAVTRFEELLFKGAREMAGGGGLQNAVGDGRDQQRARLRPASPLFDHDFEQRKRPVPILRHPVQQLRNPRPRMMRELLDGNPVATRAPGILLNPLPGVPELFGA